MNTSEFWQEVRSREKDLHASFPKGFLFVTAVRNQRNVTSADGLATEVPVAIAARMLVEGTGRVSTDAEIARLREHEQIQKALSDAQTLRTNGITRLTIESRKP